ncbi:hypothetical protein CsatB_024850 [Cannabis sativa]
MQVLVLKTIFFFMMPGENAKGLLEQVAESVKGLIQYLLELGWEAITTGISMSFDVVKEGVFGSVSVVLSSVLGLMEQTRNSFESLVKDVPELVEGFSEMASTIVSDSWNNCIDAFGYVKDQISS